MTSEHIRHFLVVYDVKTASAEVEEFDGYEDALAKYDELERQFMDNREFDVVLLGADSIETIQRTHSSYFNTTQHGFERFFEDALAAR